MKHRKRVTHALIVVGLVLTLLLQACGSNNGNGETKSAEPSSSTNSTPAASEAAPGSEAPKLEPYEVSIVYFGTPERDVPLVQEKLNEYFKDKINATVKLTPFASSDYKTKTELMMNTGEKMDLVFTASWLSYFSNVNKGAFLELDDLLAKYGQGISEQLNPIYLEAPRFKGKLYAVPTNKEITQGKAFMYRKDLVEKYNIPITEINTSADLEPWMKLMKEQEPDIYPNLVTGGGAGGDGVVYETLSNFRPIGPTPAKNAAFFYDYTKTDKVEVKSLTDPEIVAVNKEAFNVARDFYEKGYTNSDAATLKVDNLNSMRTEGKLWYGSVTWKPGADIEMSNSTNNKYEFISHVIEEPIVTTDLAAGSMFAISRTSKDPERAMMVLNYLHTDPYVVNLMVYGIEGTHFKKTGDNRIEQIPDSGYGKSALFWVIGNQMNNYLLPGQPDDLYENWKKFNNEATRSPLLGFVFDNTNVKNEETQLTAVMTEYKGIFTGAIADPAKLVDERNKKLEAAGIEKVRAEIQKQIDEWQANNK
jgi:putative aldouronate transport system substrate-binding protein